VTRRFVYPDIEFLQREPGDHQVNGAVPDVHDVVSICVSRSRPPGYDGPVAVGVDKLGGLAGRQALDGEPRRSVFPM